MPRKIKDERLGRGPDRVGSTSTVYCMSAAVAGRKRALKAAARTGGGAEVVDLQSVRAARAEAQDTQPPQRALQD